ncbi:DUF1285 domain-containing protein [Ponticaulis sp.]|uniref:DUF1285 domain-containing protein n=1 Tax=Ponticaulis sp. TaxID=2020902 RepID=UPI000B6BC148|nr:DUF1285 domain-containing protein [Ponticaulis sp.]OUY01235.1 MAG: hypothetical protein CBB65_02000 [Hyphomonadaceae bacterium TMED5]
MASQPTTDLDQLNKTLQAISPIANGNRQLPPVEKWNPEFCADIGMEIRKDGSWWHEGTKFSRQKLVRLFSTILRKDDDGSTYLVTPYEKVIVHVEDAPFIGMRVDAAQKDEMPVILVTTNLGDSVEVSAENPLRVETDEETGEPSPYVLIRGRLEAKLSRPAFYELVEYAEEKDGALFVRSNGDDFSLGQFE